MKFKLITLSCSLALVNATYINAMEMTRPSQQSTSAEAASEQPSALTTFCPSDLSHLGVIAATQNSTQENILPPSVTMQPSAQLPLAAIAPKLSGVRPSAPQLEDLLPTYQEAVETTRLETKSCSERESSRPSLSTVPQEVLPVFNDNDNEFKILLTKAQTVGETNNLLTLIKNVCKEDPKIVLENMDAIRTEVGMLPLRAAIKTGRLETVEAISPYFSREDIKTVFVETVHYNQIEIMKFFAHHYKIDFSDTKLLHDCLKSGTINPAFLNFFVENGLQIGTYKEFGHRPVTELPLWIAVLDNCPEAVKFFLENGAYIPNSKRLLAEAKLPVIRKMILNVPTIDTIENAVARGDTETINNYFKFSQAVPETSFLKVAVEKGQTEALEILLPHYDNNKIIHAIEPTITTSPLPCIHYLLQHKKTNFLTDHGPFHEVMATSVWKSSLENDNVEMAKEALEFFEKEGKYFSRSSANQIKSPAIKKMILDRIPSEEKKSDCTIQ